MSATVLVVDDHDQNRKVLSRRLERRGFKVEQAADGAEAIAMTKSLLPDCVLMDLSMPTVSGFAALEQIRADPATREIPAVALTAHAMEDIRARCIESGFAAFKTKPLDFPDLVSCLNEILAAEDVAETPPVAGAA